MNPQVRLAALESVPFAFAITDVGSDLPRRAVGLRNKGATVELISYVPQVPGSGFRVESAGLRGSRQARPRTLHTNNKRSTLNTSY